MAGGQSAPHLEDLLEPSLGAQTSVRSLYSARACFLIAYLGGPFAAVGMGFLNARRLGRVPRDLPLLALGALLAAAGILAATYVAAKAGTSSHAIGLGFERRDLRYGIRALALACFGLYYLRHRQFLRAMQMSGHRPASPWAVGIGVGIASMLLQAALIGAGVAAWI